jgi:hypothetical protein
MKLKSITSSAVSKKIKGTSHNPCRGVMFVSRSRPPIQIDQQDITVSRLPSENGFRSLAIQSRILFSLIALSCKSPCVRDIKSDMLRLKTGSNGERRAPCFFFHDSHISFDLNQLDD